MLNPAHGVPAHAPPQPPQAGQAGPPQQAQGAAQGQLPGQQVAQQAQPHGVGMFRAANVDFGGGDQGTEFTITSSLHSFFRKQYWFLERDFEDVCSQVGRLTVEAGLAHNGYIAHVLEEQFNLFWQWDLEAWDGFVAAQQHAVANNPLGPPAPWLPGQPPGFQALPPPQPPLPPAQLAALQATRAAYIAGKLAQFAPLAPNVQNMVQMGIMPIPFPSEVRTLIQPNVNFNAQLIAEVAQGVSRAPFHPPRPPNPQGHPPPPPINHTIIPNNPANLSVANYLRLYYRPQRVLQPYARVQGLGAIVSQVIRQMQTNVRNMISAKNVHIHLKGLFRLKLWPRLSSLNGGVGRRRLNITKRTAAGAAGFIFGLVYRRDPFLMPNKLDDFVQRAINRQVHGHATLQNNVDRYCREVYDWGMAMFGQVDLRPASIENEWDQWYPRLYYIQRCFDESPGVRGVFKKFSLAPHPDNKLPLILVTTQGLHEILMLSKTLRNHGALPQAEQDRIHNLNIPTWNAIRTAPNAAQLGIALWRRFTKFESFETQNHKFAASIRVDGVNTHLNMRKPTRSGIPVTLENYLQRPADDRDLRGKLVSSCDPNRGKTTYHATVDVPGNIVNKRPHLRPSDLNGWPVDYDRGFTTNEYYHRAGFDWEQKLREKCMNADPHIQYYNKHVPSNHTVDHARLLIDLNFRLRHLSRLLLFYGARRWRMMKLKARSTKQRALAALVQKFTRGRDPAECIIAWGAAEFDHASRGHRACPYKLIRKVFASAGVTVILVDEKNTSRVCSKCHQWFPKERGTKQKLWHVRSCTRRNGGCGTTWDRDRNAARNILFLFFFANARNTVARPGLFA
ncbi:hypothetical protein M427DRAFT_133504 [Gonapodya prolifera JEL478]|uniref:Cas12f1-like TNB domain-containing protein n=1 Tax=Gonapodya prolifera (strain JEL478) TaxID=1344416 RepID=A0A139ALF5_GONPJ|nr:hypothetical protein M427DRAFT_133504 [Gonapodya prolifera JEL478]|eukprot:KXS17374.1 hypothetical protein M427DRAFT_133504 [Gonapodya prolifera JEL478]